jgi:hypothetical protein
VYISFNPSPPESFLHPDQTGPAETALVVRVGDQTYYLILDGDFRSAYQQAFVQYGSPGILNLFLASREFSENDWSSTKDWKHIQHTILNA